MQKASKRIKKPNVVFLGKIMGMHLPIISRYAFRRLEKWYWEEEPEWISQNM